MNTKEIIINSAYELFEEIPFEEITVQKILDKAHVSRRTFYKYFLDKYELMHLYCYSFLEKNFAENYNGRNWDTIMEYNLLFIDSKKAYFNNVKNVQGQDSLWNFLRQYGFGSYKDIKLKNEQREELTESKRLIIIAVVEGQIEIMKRFIEGDINMDCRETARLVCSLIPDSYQKYPCE